MKVQGIIKGQFSSKPYSQTSSAFLLQVSVQEVTSGRKTSCLHYKQSCLKGETECWGAGSAVDPKEETGASCSLHTPSACTRHLKTALKNGNLPSPESSGAAAHSQVARAKHNVSFVLALTSEQCPHGLMPASCCHVLY